MKKQERNGFTLIEVLVVVLIIGILTSVALPQYQKAVLKSRFAQAKITARAIADAEEVYYATYNTYTRNIEALDVSLPPTTKTHFCNSEYCTEYFSWGDCSIVVMESGRNNVQCTIRQNGKEYLGYVLGFSNSNWNPEQALCVAYGNGSKPTASDMTYQICQNETQKNSAAGFGSTSVSMQY